LGYGPETRLLRVGDAEVTRLELELEQELKDNNKREISTAAALGLVGAAVYMTHRRPEQRGKGIRALASVLRMCLNSLSYAESL